MLFFHHSFHACVIWHSSERANSAKRFTAWWKALDVVAARNMAARAAHSNSRAPSLKPMES
eukprot:1472559-Pyramimonas_sp.AAC.1